MTWQRYKLNLRNSLLLEEYFRVLEQFDSILSSVIDSTLRMSLGEGKDICLFKMPIEGILNKNILEIVLLSQWNVVLLHSYMIVEYYKLKQTIK